MDWEASGDVGEKVTWHLNGAEILDTQTVDQSCHPSRGDDHRTDFIGSLRAEAKTELRSLCGNGEEGVSLPKKSD